MEEVEIKTTAELIDELVTTNLKIWHLVDRGYAGDGEAAVEAQRLNQRRNLLMIAINGRFHDTTHGIARKVYSADS